MSVLMFSCPTGGAPLPLEAMTAMCLRRSVEGEVEEERRRRRIRGVLEGKKGSSNQSMTSVQRRKQEVESGRIGECRIGITEYGVCTWYTSCRMVRMRPEKITMEVSNPGSARLNITIALFRSAGIFSRWRWTNRSIEGALNVTSIHRHSRIDAMGCHQVAFRHFPPRFPLPDFFLFPRPIRPDTPDYWSTQ